MSLLDNSIYNNRFKIESKKCINQFLPISCRNLTLSKKIIFKSKNLKTSYLIDIVHNLIWKYYSKRENSFNLSSIVLKDRYGVFYNYYIEYLVNEKILKLKKNYRKGFNSRVYELNTKILTSEVLRHQNFDKILLKKWKRNILQNLCSDNNLIETSLKQKLVSDLFSVSIDYDKAFEYLESSIDDESVLNRNLYSIQSIQNGDLFYHFDSFGRFHTNFTILKSHIRKNFLFIDGEPTYEIDIKNSQPLFLSKLIYDSNRDLILDKEVSDYMSICMEGRLYNYIQDKIGVSNKSDIKNMMYKVFFGKNYSNKHEKSFQAIFPNILKFIKNYKKSQNDYRALSWKLQQLESQFIFNVVIYNLFKENPNLKIITCHDSLIIKRSDFDLVNTTFEKYFVKEFSFISNREFEYI